MKFDLLLQYVKDELGIDKIATGHYARTTEGVLKKAKDEHKDQTYFLFEIPKKTLANIYFPNGDYTKDEIRQIAKEHSITVAKKAESQEICFIPDNDVPSFIEDYYPEFVKGKGKFVDQKGSQVGSHRGIHAYTIGQRRGLGIGFGERKYVTAINSETSEVILGDNKDLFKNEMVVKDLNMLEECSSEFDAFVKIRYKSPATKAIVRIEDNKAFVKFDEPVRAITPGQAAVFYVEDTVVGGGWIV